MEFQKRHLDGLRRVLEQVVVRLHGLIEVRLELVGEAEAARHASHDAADVLFQCDPSTRRYIREFIFARDSRKQPACRGHFAMQRTEAAKQLRTRVTRGSKGQPNPTATRIAQNKTKSRLNFSATHPVVAVVDAREEVVLNLCQTHARKLSSE